MKGHHDSLRVEEEFFSQKGFVNTFPPSVYGKILSEFDIRKGSFGLEMCCGEGAVSRQIQDCVVDGIEISDTLLKKAVHLRKKVVGDAHYPNKYFNTKYDWILFWGALHHLPRQKVCLANCGKVLKKNGRILFFEPNALHIPRQVLMNKNLTKKYTGEERALNPYRVKKLLEGLDYRITKLMFLSPDYNRMSALARLQQIMRLVPSKLCQTFWVMIAEK